MIQMRAPSALPRRFVPLAFASVVLMTIAFFSLALKEDSWTDNLHMPFTTDDGSPSLALPTWRRKHNAGETLRIAILETGGTHDEVSAALMHAFGSIRDAELRLYFKAQRFNMEDIMANFTLQAPVVELNSSDSFTAAMYGGPAPHVLVSTTCEIDAAVRPATFHHLLTLPTTHLFCVFHHADRWVSGGHVDTVRQWYEQDRVDFVALSNHTAQFLRNSTQSTWAERDPVDKLVTRVLPPLFPVYRPEVQPEAPVSLSIQGDYSSGRRNYKAIFNGLGDVITKVSETAGVQASKAEKTVDLHVIGHGQAPEVPEQVKDRVFFDSGLSYPDFYALISRSFSVLPGFASDDYYDRKASSTIPAALIAGAPVVASKRLLESYSYLPAGAAWMAESDDEDDMHVIQRAVADREAYAKKRDFVRATCARLIRENEANTLGWINFGLEKRAVREKAQKAIEAIQRKRLRKEGSS
ncbi:hypothetical protein B0T11DRAFT_142146 [Plectosphaerella cucumerina]|uniref:Uncharacterized protein n=1 Tax=Plectosphaerella cucumerina TaxID=40658 RepID=A0A8K0T4H1_9PEZI|nr:hypothetical protein B0T11DRAFT_142146 [Plectosphaerella cucumerina]